MRRTHMQARLQKLSTRHKRTLRSWFRAFSDFIYFFEYMSGRVSLITINRSCCCCCIKQSTKIAKRTKRQQQKWKRSVFENRCTQSFLSQQIDKFANIFSLLLLLFRFVLYLLCLCVRAMQYVWRYSIAYKRTYNANWWHIPFNFPKKKLMPQCARMSVCLSLPVTDTSIEMCARASTIYGKANLHDIGPGGISCIQINEATKNNDKNVKTLKLQWSHLTSEFNSVYMPSQIFYIANISIIHAYRI